VTSTECPLGFESIPRVAGNLKLSSTTCRTALMNAAGPKRHTESVSARAWDLQGNVEQCNSGMSDGEFCRLIHRTPHASSNGSGLAHSPQQRLVAKPHTGQATTAIRFPVPTPRLHQTFFTSKKKPQKIKIFSSNHHEPGRRRHHAGHVRRCAIESIRPSLPGNRLGIRAAEHHHTHRRLQQRNRC